MKKLTLVDELGGKCSKCGYDDNKRVLNFHHVDPSTKSFGISSKLGMKLDTLRVEAAKCILLCANCHAIEHLVGVDESFIALVKKI